MSESYRRRLHFYLARAMDRMRNKRRRQAVIKHLRDRRYALSIFLRTPNGDKHLAEGQLIDYGQAELLVGVFSSNKRLSEVDPTGRRVVVFHRPFNVAGERVNAFETYVAEVARSDASRQSMKLLSPIGFEHLPRRRFDRRNVRDNRAFHCKVWIGPEKDAFWSESADVFVGAVSPEGKKRGAARIVNISQGGMSLAVHPAELRRALRRGARLGLALKAYDVERRDYRVFLLRARAASVRRDSSGMLLVGLEFRSQARRESKGGALNWRTTMDGVREVGEIIAAMDSRAEKRSKGNEASIES
ncbi:MAG: hypothetical protein ACOCVM_04505 [Desulfovibrionaceae bacterium]